MLIAKVFILKSQWHSFYELCVIYFIEYCFNNKNSKNIPINLIEFTKNYKIIIEIIHYIN